jgi:hypothetical protein
MTPAFGVAYLATIPKSATVTLLLYPLLQQGVKAADVVVNDESDDLWHAQSALHDFCVVGFHGNYDNDKF